MSGRNIFEAFIITLIIVDMVLLMLITFVNVVQSLLISIIYFDLFVCFILFIDFIYRMRQEDDNRKFIKRNWPDIVAMLPLDILFFLHFNISHMFYFIRFLRLLRLVRLVALFRRNGSIYLDFLSRHISI